MGEAAGKEPAGEDPGLETAERTGGARRRLSRRQVLTHGATAVGALAVGAAGEARIQRWMREAEVPPPAAPSALLNDASGLDATPVRGVTFAAASTEVTAARVGPLLRQIANGDEPALVVSGARHSMGGQSLLRGGWVLDTLPMNSVTVDGSHQTMRVGAGATWRTIIRCSTPRDTRPW